MIKKSDSTNVFTKAYIALNLLSRINLAGIPVIIYSTSPYIKDIDTCFKKNAHFYNVKPASVQHLFSILDKVMNSLKESLERPCKERFVVRVVGNYET